MDQRLNNIVKKIQRNILPVLDEEDFCAHTDEFSHGFNNGYRSAYNDLLQFIHDEQVEYQDQQQKSRVTQEELHDLLDG